MIHEAKVLINTFIFILLVEKQLVSCLFAHILPVQRRYHLIRHRRALSQFDP